MFLLGFNLLLCAYASGDKEKMKKAFQKLSQISTGIEDEEKYSAQPVRILFYWLFKTEEQNDSCSYGWKCLYVSFLQEYLALLHFVVICWWNNHEMLDSYSSFTHKSILILVLRF